MPGPVPGETGVAGILLGYFPSSYVVALKPCEWVTSASVNSIKGEGLKIVFEEL